MKEKESPQVKRLPIWLRRDKDLSGLREIRLRLRQSSLSTVCEEARCPNIAECFSRHDATFLILGDICTRACAFCAVKKGQPLALDPDEPQKVALAARALGLKHVVITSVTRDDRPDKGALTFAATISQVKRHLSQATVEVLTPDFSGARGWLEAVLEARPDVFGHNVETVGSLYGAIRPGADLIRSLKLLRWAKETAPGVKVKSGFMVGLGETEKEIRDLIVALCEAGVDIVTIGQYLQPSRAQREVRRYWEPEYFDVWACVAKEAGIRYVVSGPMVRSSYRASELWEMIKRDAICED